jgi:hypothetical protein
VASFEGEIILWSVRWYCRYGIIYRDLEQMMGERGVPVDRSTIYRWVPRYAPEMEKRLRWQWRRPQSPRPSQSSGNNSKPNPRDASPGKGSVADPPRPHLNLQQSHPEYDSNWSRY